MSLLAAGKGFIRNGTKCMIGREIGVINLGLGGTVVDDKLTGVVTALKTAFRMEGIKLDEKRARGPMGISKSKHITQLCRLPEVRTQWVELKKSELTEEDEIRIYNRYCTYQIALSANGRYTDLFPEFVTASAKLKNKLKFSVTTGFTRRMLTPILSQMAKQRFIPTVSCASDEVLNSRPAPDAIRHNLDVLKMKSSQLLGIGDTPEDMKEINAAGGVACGVVRRGNILGMHLTEDKDPESMHLREDYRFLVEKALFELVRAGADYVMYDFSSLNFVLEDIESVNNFHRRNVASS